MNKPWKANWEETREHFRRWWKHDGLVLGSWGCGLQSNLPPHDVVQPPPPPATPFERHCDAQFVARNIRWQMARRAWPADMLPVAWPDIGTVNVAACLGAVPSYAENNVWYEPCIASPDLHPPLQFDPRHSFCRRLEKVVRETVAQSRGNYLVGMPAIAPNLDVLAELRGVNELMIDLVDRPAWVHAKLEEIETAYRQAFDWMYEMIRLDDDSMAFGYFMLWGEGRTGLLQCDVAAMVSPEMFREFAVPYLKQSCAFLDHSMFHVDGHQCLAHVDALLEISELDAIEWTPDPRVPPGGDPHWYPLYRRILAAGKSVWIANVDAAEVIPLLDAIGARGVYVAVATANGRRLTVSDMERLADSVESYRR